MLFIAGLVANALIGFHNDHFLASRGQLVGAAAVSLALVALAFLLPRRKTAPLSGWIPNPWTVGALALLAGSAVLLTPSRWNWGAAGSILAVDLLVAFAVWLWSQRVDWNLRHKLALASGAALAYAWHAFIEKPVIGGSALSVVRSGNALFAAGAMALIVLAASRTNAWMVSGDPTHAPSS